jgi:hypothetical protein
MLNGNFSIMMARLRYTAVFHMDFELVHWTERISTQHNESFETQHGTQHQRQSRPKRPTDHTNAG